MKTKKKKKKTKKNDREQKKNIFEQPSFHGDFIIVTPRKMRTYFTQK